MSRVLNVDNGDYRIRVKPGGNIILDTVNSIPGSYGYVTILGNLDVQGAITYVESTNTRITDNILDLNYGQTGNGVDPAGVFDLARQSGIRIKRGNYSDALFVFKENQSHYDPVTSSTVLGTFVLKTADGTLKGLQLASISNSGSTNFVFDMQNQPYALAVANTGSDGAGQLGEAYANLMYPLLGSTRTTENNFIPNRRFITKYVAASEGVASVDRLYFPIDGPFASATASIRVYASSILFQISTVTKATISASGLTVNNVNLYTDTVNNNTNNLILSATATNTIEVSGVMQLDNQASAPTYNSAGTQIYSRSTIGPGKTGIYFTNQNASQTPDELVSRNGAVLLSILL